MSPFATAARSVTVAALITFSACGWAATAAASPATEADTQTLIDLLPTGFTGDNCHSVTPSQSRQLAIMECGKNADPSGPGWGRFTLYSDTSSMDSTFSSIIADDELLTCHDGWSPSPTNWRSDLGNGQVSCGLYEGDPELVWTNNTTSVLGVITRLDIDSLFAWWQAKG
jgi:serine/threonine kinase PknH